MNQANGQPVEAENIFKPTTSKKPGTCPATIQISLKMDSAPKPPDRNPDCLAL